MFRTLADGAAVPVVCHIDHALTLEECRDGIDSRLHLGHDRRFEAAARRQYRCPSAGRRCRRAARGFGRGRGRRRRLCQWRALSTRPRPRTPARLERETGVDALAVSVGNVHLADGKDVVRSTLTRSAAIEAQTNVPLVLHGGSGIPAADARNALRAIIASQSSTLARSCAWPSATPCAPIWLTIPESFDRIEIFSRDSAHPQSRRRGRSRRRFGGPPGQRRSVDRSTMAHGNTVASWRPVGLLDERRARARPNVE